MFVKGITASNIKKYIIENHKDSYDLWLNSLPEESRDIYSATILAEKLYPILSAIIYPTEKTGELFFNGDIKKAAYQMGYDSAQKALNSIYRIFLRISSLNFIIKKAKSIYSSFYNAGEVELLDKQAQKLSFNLSKIPKEEKLNIIRISGWIDGFLSQIGFEPKNVEYKIVEKGEFVTGEINIYWDSPVKY